MTEAEELLWRARELLVTDNRVYAKAVLRRIDRYLKKVGMEP